MADKRMFTKKITQSDSFISMPMTTQCLYFHLNMMADDDGFVNNPNVIRRMIGASEDDLKLLIAKSFLLVFETGVIVIKHWRMHNTIRQDRYHPTDYQEEYNMLSLKPNKSYTFDDKKSVATKWQPIGNQLATEIRLDKNRLDKNSLSHICELHKNCIDENCWNCWKINECPFDVRQITKADALDPNDLSKNDVINLMAMIFQRNRFYSFEKRLENGVLTQLENEYDIVCVEGDE